VILPIVGEGLVEGRVLLRGDVLGVSGPERLGLVELLVLGGDLKERKKKRREKSVDERWEGEKEKRTRRTSLTFLVFFSLGLSSSSISSILFSSLDSSTSSSSSTS